MKVCPYCNGITEESRAIKCSVCGKDISSEPDYTEEELSDQVIKDELDNIYQKKIRNKKIKKILLPCGIILGICLIFVITYLIKPSGYIHIKEDKYHIRIGETCEVVPIYGGKVSAEDVKIVIESQTDCEDVSFRWWIEDNKFYFTGEKEDIVKLTFKVKDNGEQSKYNNEIYISISTLLGE